MCMRFCIAFAVFAALALTQRVTAAPSPQELVKATLLADVDAVKPGEPFTLGVLLKMKPHWHVYWKNPGDSGMATRVDWKLPDGFTAGPLQFPIPVRFDQPGDVIGYGYTEEVLLTSTITPPNNLPAGRPLEFAANVAWLVCDDVCIPGRAELKLDLPASESASPANAAIFARWKARLPRPAQEAKEDVKQATLDKSAEDVLRAGVEFFAPVKDVRWFPVPPEESGVERVQTAEEGAVSSFSFRLVPPPAAPEPMSFLVVYKTDQDQERGVEFTVKLPPLQ